jgi:hypothetical protein
MLFGGTFAPQIMHLEGKPLLSIQILCLREEKRQKMY